jgi:hypothetical protein
VRRLARYILNALTVLSLVLCVATMVLWVRSYSVFDYVRRTDADFIATRIASSLGHFSVCTIDLPNFVPPGWDRGNEPARPWDLPSIVLDSGSFYPDQDLRLGVFRWSSGEVRDLRSFHVSLLVIPQAMVTGLFAIFPGRCQSCGYDLRCTPDRCPECGNIPEKVNT